MDEMEAADEERLKNEPPAFKQKLTKITWPMSNELKSDKGQEPRHLAEPVQTCQDSPSSHAVQCTTIHSSQFATILCP